MTSHEDRRTDTRARLLAAAADLFAERGIDGATVNAIAERADRTSGAIYDHFESKDGLLFALLDGWVDDVAAVIGAQRATRPEAGESLDEWLAALWSGVSSSDVGGGRWIALEHELWSYAARNPEARDHLARRYRAAWRGVESAITRRLAADEAAEPGTGSAVIGVLFGLEMMHRIQPGVITEPIAVGALRGAVASAAMQTA